jgi:ribosome modulation factor
MAEAKAILRAKRMGETAFAKGRTEDQCPFKGNNNPQCHAGWRNGWDDAQYRARKEAPTELADIAEYRRLDSEAEKASETVTALRRQQGEILLRHNEEQVATKRAANAGRMRQQRKSAAQANFTDPPGSSTDPFDDDRVDTIIGLIRGLSRADQLRIADAIMEMTAPKAA